MGSRTRTSDRRRRPAEETDQPAQAEIQIVSVFSVCLTSAAADPGADPASLAPAG